MSSEHLKIFGHLESTLSRTRQLLNIFKINNIKPKHSPTKEVNLDIFIWLCLNLIIKCQKLTRVDVSHAQN